MMNDDSPLSKNQDLKSPDLRNHNFSSLTNDLRKDKQRVKSNVRFGESSQGFHHQRPHRDHSNISQVSQMSSKYYNPHYQTSFPKNLPPQPSIPYMSQAYPPQFDSFPYHRNMSKGSALFRENSSPY